MVASVVLPTPGGPNRIMELGAVRLPLLGRIGEAAQRRALAQHLRLANHLVQSAWTHAHRQRRRHRLRRISRPKQIVLTHNVL